MSPAGQERLRLLCRDLAAAAAYAAMAVSGELPAWTIVLFTVGLALALLGRRPLHGATTVSALLLVLAVVVIYAGVLRGRTDLVVGACAFAGLLATQRMLATPSPAADRHVHLTGLLMLAGGAALSGELLFAVALAAYLVASTLAMTLGVLKPGALGAAGPRRALLRKLSGALAAAAALTLIFFILFPRLSWNLSGRHRGLRAITGLNDAVSLTGQGLLKTDPRLVLKATLKPDPVRPTLEAYWVAHAYDTFDGQTWSASPRNAHVAFLLHREPAAGGALTTQQVELLPGYGRPVLVGLDRPVLFEHAYVLLGDHHFATRFVDSPGELVRLERDGDSYHYDVTSRMEGAAAPLTVRERQGLLQLPPHLHSAIAALAAQLTRGEHDPARQARTLEQYLKTHYRYSLELKTVPDPLGDFLLHSRQGHCEHFATALAILLRTLGIPARVVTGFYGGTRLSPEGVYGLRASDAHAWVEAYLPATGFIRLDATPEADRGNQAGPLLTWLLQNYDLLDSLWQAKVVDYSIRDQVGLVRSLGALHWSPSGPPSLPRATAAGVAALLLGLLLYRAWAWLRARRPHPATLLRQGAERILARQGVQPADLGELWHSLRSTDHPLREAVEPLRRRYLAARFGTEPLPAGQRRALLAAFRADARRAAARAGGLPPDLPIP